MHTGPLLLLIALSVLSLWYVWRWTILERSRTTNREPEAQRSGAAPRPADLLIGFGTNFFDTLGIGSFAPTTAIFKFRRWPPDENIPGTLNAGHALPTVAQALIFISVVDVDVATLASLILAAVLGAWLGVGIVARLPRRAIQIGMGIALLFASVLFLAQNLQWMPGGAQALGLHGGKLAFAVAVSFVLGALMMLGVGMYGPSLILVSLLGMNPITAFPIMMGSCAFLMPIGGARFIQTGRYDLRSTLGLTIGGLPAVLIAAFIVKSLPIEWLRWLVLGVVLYAATLMLLSASGARSAAPRAAA